MKEQRKSYYGLRAMVLALIIGLIAGLLGAVLAAQVFIKPGPQGEQGIPGEQGPQGIAGTDGTDGIDSILQIFQNRNNTQVDISSYTAMDWNNFSVFDSAMEITLNVEQDSRIFAQFSCTSVLEPPASVWVRLVVDNAYNSCVSICSTGPPASGTYKVSGCVEFLTDILNAGWHTINVQFLREIGSPEVLDRTLTVLEVAQ